MNSNMREDLMALTTNKPHWSRRDFMAGSVASGIASGFALAAQPLCAQTIINTDGLDLHKRMVQVSTDDGHIPTGGTAARHDAGL